MNKTPIDHDSDSLRERSRQTAGIRGERFSRVAAKIAQGGTIGELRDEARKTAEEEGWVGFRPMDKRIVSEVVEGNRTRQNTEMFEVKNNTATSVNALMSNQFCEGDMIDRSLEYAEIYFDATSIDTDMLYNNMRLVDSERAEYLMEKYKNK